MDKCAPRSLVETSINEFITKHPEAELRRLPNDDYSVCVPGVALDPTAWSKSSSGVAFVVPAAFPIQRPDCFWTDGDLMLSGGRAPSNSQLAPQHPVYPGLRWFSYHSNTWSNRDTVETYFHLISGRLLEAR